MNKSRQNTISIAGREIGPEFPPFVIAEIGINHEGNMDKAKQMVSDAKKAGAECVKFQAHVIDDEMIPAAQQVVPKHTTESIWEIMKRCALSETQDRELKIFTESLGLIYLSTPFSRAAAERLKRLNVPAYKIGSGECNNYPLIEHIASIGKPIILSTGMNDIDSVKPAVNILRKHNIPYALLHCTSMYPTPYDKVRLGAITDLASNFPDAVIGFSDHSLHNYACFAALSLGASILEKHFTSDKSWPGPDIALSMDPVELEDLVRGAQAIHQAIGGNKTVLTEELPTADFAYACVVTIRDIKKGEIFSTDNIWVKRPGTGKIRAGEYENLLGRRSARDLAEHTQLSFDDLEKS